MTSVPTCVRDVIFILLFSRAHTKVGTGFRPRRWVMREEASMPKDKRRKRYLQCSSSKCKYISSTRPYFTMVVPTISYTRCTDVRYTSCTNGFFNDVTVINPFVRILASRIRTITDVCIYLYGVDVYRFRCTCVSENVYIGV